jgi:arylsulfatase A-like enzyme/Flp pilus assembly protein TadD
LTNAVRFFLPALIFATRLAFAAPDVILITLDTTRADAIGKNTPNLEALAKGGIRYTRAITPAPLTLPAHASLLTGLEPPEHGVRDNGTASLPRDVPTLPALLRQRGYVTGAFVSSRVLDRRFGLGRGFDVYDDSMAAEEIGEYGYPERDAAQVTTAALAWAARQTASKPMFLWIHYYDAHAPYAPPAPLTGYAGEVAYVDREVGRLLSKLRKTKRIVVVAGDHGESLGEHGERTHGVFLYRSVLEVPLLISGAGATRVVPHVVSTNRIAATIAHLAGASAFGDPLPPFGASRPPVYSETQLPATAYGWSALRAYSDDRFRFIDAPRVELYDFVADPAEARNLAGDQRRELFRLKNAMTAALQKTKTRDAGAGVDPALAASLRSLGYLSGVSGQARSNIDPKDGMSMLAEMETLRARIGGSDAGEVAARAGALAQRSPGNVPFLTLAGEAWLAAGDSARALDAYRRAASLNPSLDFLHLNLANAHRAAGDAASAEKEYRLVLQLNPRLAAASIQLAEMKPREARAILRASVDAGSASASVLTRLAQLGEPDADTLLREAVRLAPRWAPAWMLIAVRAKDIQQARDAWRRAAAYAPRDPRPLLALGKSYLAAGERVQAQAYLDRVITLAPRSAEAREARALQR